MVSRSSTPTSAANRRTVSGSSVSRRNATVDICRWLAMRNSTSSRDSAGSARRSKTPTGEADALRDVLLVARLPDVVQQQREHQQLGALEVLQQRGEPLALARLRRPDGGAASRSIVRMASSVCSSTVYLW